MLFRRFLILSSLQDTDVILRVSELVTEQMWVCVCVCVWKNDSKEEWMECVSLCVHLWANEWVSEGIKPLNAELNPICYLLALLGAHHFLHVSRIRVKSLSLRQLMSYIYIYNISCLRVNTSAHCSGRKQVKG